MGPSFPWNGHRMSWVEPEVASHLPPAVQSSERTRAPYPDIRMSLRSESRQPCSVGSCMEVTANLPSVLKTTPRWEPLHSSVAGSLCAFGNQSVMPL